MENRDPLTERIIGCCYKVHSELGPGFNEKVYHRALIFALKEIPLNFATEKEFEIFFNDKKIGSLRLDLIVEGKVIVEVKALMGYLPEVF